MTLSGLKLTAALTAMASLALVACSGETEMAGDDPLRDAAIARGEDPAPPMDPAEVQTQVPPSMIPNGPPEIPPQAPQIPSQPQTPLDSTDPTAPIPGAPPPVLPDSPPN